MIISNLLWHMRIPVWLVGAMGAMAVAMAVAVIRAFNMAKAMHKPI